MRNLAILSEGQLDFNSRYFPDLIVKDSFFNSINDTITCLLSSSDEEVYEVQQIGKSGETKVLCYFESPCMGSKLICFKQFGDSESLIFVFENGDVIAALIFGENPEDFSMEIVGLLDTSIAAAKWSPDEEILVLVTTSSKMSLLSRSFEPITEVRLDAKDASGTIGSNVSVGWGKKETQFQGKGFKALEREREALKYAGLDLQDSTQLRDPTVRAEEKGSLSFREDGKISISWRDDCNIFAVSLILEDENMEPRRVVRIFDRHGTLEAMSEAANGLDAHMSWRSQGNLLAATRTVVDDSSEISHVIFFERNGLRHGEFETTNVGITDLSWSCDGAVLAVLYNEKAQFWTTKNYHWYLKQEIWANENDPFASIKFHPEKAFTVMLTSWLHQVKIVSFTSVVNDGPTVAGLDKGLVNVIDGCRVKMTPLAISNIPPPMSMTDIDHPLPVKSTAFNHLNSTLYALTSVGEIFATSGLLFPITRPSKPTQLLFVSTIKSSGLKAKQICTIQPELLITLSDSHTSSHLHVFDIRDGTLVYQNKFSCKAVILKLLADQEGALLEMHDGKLFAFDSKRMLYELPKFPQMCILLEAKLVEIDTERSILAVGLTESGKLFVGDKLLANGVTSFKLSDQFLCITTAQSKLLFIHFKNIMEADLPLISHSKSHDERSRDIERGSSLVTVIPSKYCVVLQAQRGNLETIYPRIMVLQAIRSFIKNARYTDAFTACRAHRIDLDILHDYDARAFEKNIAQFIGQVQKVEFLDLFVSCLHEYDVTKEKYSDTLQEFENTEKAIAKEERPDIAFVGNKVNRICEIMLRELSKEIYLETYLQVRITAFACQKPPNDKGALEAISHLDDSLIQDHALTHLCYLRDAVKLYEEALSLYNVNLALKIAQKSQMDPKEYLPFLQTLYDALITRRKFLIDDHLKHFGSALGWLFELTNETSEEFEAYVVSHDLYTDALSLTRRDDRTRKLILKLFALYLSETLEHAESARLFELLGEQQLALDNFFKARLWKESLSIARKIKSEEDFDSMAAKLASQLEEDHKYADAATIQADFLHDKSKAVQLFCKAFQFDTAFLIARVANSDSMDELLNIEIRESFGIMSELLADCNGQLTSQLRRLREIRRKKDLDPVTFYGAISQNLDAPDDVSVAASDASTNQSFFTRYTGKSNETAKTGDSRRTLKNKKREERKRAKGRKGTVYEEEYLIRSVGRLVERLDSSMKDAENLVNILIRRSMWEEAYQLRNLWSKVTEFLEQNLIEIHDVSDEKRERLDDEGNVYLEPKIPMPTVKPFPRIQALEFV